MAMPSSLATPTPAAADLAAMMRAVDPAQTASVARLALAPNEQFFLRHHPGQWDAESVGLTEVTWLPDISKLVLLPGAHLVRTRKKGDTPNETFRNALNVDGNKGWVHLDPNDAIPADYLPAGVPAGGYLRSLPCKDPRSSAEGVRYVEAWDVPRAPVPGQPQKFKYDRGAYNRWRLWLVTSGKIKPPTEDVLGEMQAAKAGRPARVASLPIPDDLRRIRVEAAEAVLQDMAGAVTPGPARKPVDDDAVAAERARLDEEREEIARERAALRTEQRKLDADRKKAAKSTPGTPPADPPGGES
jgi:hypothetical protein